eukprot:TRINITY_DN947_c0_g4_i1.p1 TRINITY_DN947_c0_g4~~TRINITY_DN947_c0_g4_i1.p1  ORF type:complete len:104 (+),score=0.34 TRINITY_DN947_c0_g4_i1:274-585(+)
MINLPSKLFREKILNLKILNLPFSLVFRAKFNRNRNCSYLFFLFGDGPATASSVFFLFGDGQATTAKEQWQRRWKPPSLPSPMPNAENGRGRPDLRSLSIIAS